MTENRPAIWWVRRDLRLHDNLAFQAAAARGGTVVPLFILDDSLLDSANSRSGKREAFLFGGLRSLDAGLRERGSRLIIRGGPVQKVLEEVSTECAATAIFAEEDYAPQMRRLDAAIAKHLPLSLVPGLSIFHPKAVLKSDGGAYTVFTPFSRAWKALPIPAAGDLQAVPAKIGVPPGLSSADLPSTPSPALFPPGEKEAHRRLEAFSRGAIFGYSEGRDQLGVEGTSTLSPYFRFGMISAREAVALARNLAGNLPPRDAGRRGIEVWVNELIWREFYMSVLYHFPFVPETAFNPSLRDIEWRHDPGQLRAWQEGQTGFPVVDAGMRQLLATGWMHNRARMITASFLVKDLLIDWQEGERWFMRQLVDGDLAANNGGWQWTAGVGTDAAPYFRIFSPVLQGKRFDPQGIYVRRWVPELERVPDKFIHEPWLMPAELQKSSACVVGRDYPRPMVDRAVTRERALEAYRKVRRACRE